MIIVVVVVRFHRMMMGITRKDVAAVAKSTLLFGVNLMITVAIV